MDTKKVLSIDIGIINLGYVFVEMGETINVLDCNRVDITYMKHDKIPYHDCKLCHEYCIPDFIDHFVQEHSSLFEEAYIILVERQPPQGLLNVQDLLFVKYRNKIKLINPNSIHKFFKMTKGDYDLRKIESVNLTIEHLAKFLNFQINERKHDMSDAMLMCIYYYELNKPKVKVKVKVNIQKYTIDDLEQFRFIKTF